MNPENETVRVIRVENGWIVGPSSWNRDDCMNQQFVARTPAELADLLRAWADAQEKK